MMAMETVTSWIRGSLIGAGAYGMVNLALNKSNGQLFAVKSIECNERARGAMQAMENELEMLQSLNSKRVVRCFGSDLTSEEGRVIKNMFMEHMAGGSLADLMAKFGGHFDEALIRNYTRDILEGVEYLHSKGIVHCDIKGKNVLAGSSGAKLADFGGAKRVNSDSDSSNSGSVVQIKGTPLWMAPEVANQKEQGPPSDIWSLGCTVVEMATGKNPWSESQIGVDPMVALYHIGCHDEVPVLPSCLSKQGQDFLTKCLQRDPSVRWTAAQLLQHPFVTEEFCSRPCSIIPEASSAAGAAAPKQQQQCQDSPVSVLESHRTTSASNTCSSIDNSVPILKCPDFSTRFPAAFNFPAPLQRQESTTSSASVSDFWADSPVTPQPNEWIVVRSPKTPSPSLSPSSTPCPARKMLAPIFSSTPEQPKWLAAVSVAAAAAPKSKEVSTISTKGAQSQGEFCKENPRPLASSSSTDNDAQRRISSSSAAVLRFSGSDIPMAEAQGPSELLLLEARPAIFKNLFPGDTHTILGGRQLFNQPSCSTSSSSIGSRRDGGDRDREGEVGLERHSSFSRLIHDEDVSDAMARGRRRRGRENADEAIILSKQQQAPAAGISIDNSSASSSSSFFLLRGPGLSESCDHHYHHHHHHASISSSSSFSSLCWNGDDSRERPVKMLRCASSPSQQQRCSGMSFDSTTAAAVATLADQAGLAIPPFRARTDSSDSHEQQIPHSIPPFSSSSHSASGSRFLTWRSQRSRDQFTGATTNSIHSSSISSDSVKSASAKSSTIGDGVAIIVVPRAASSDWKRQHPYSNTDSFSIKNAPPTPCGSYTYSAACT